MDHIPNIATMEPSDQFKNRLQFFASSGGLRINGLKASDQGDYIFSVDGQEFRVMQLLLNDKIKEVIGVLGSSVLLDPELKVDPSKNYISWTFYGDYILSHIPGHITMEPTDQFKSRLKFNPSMGTLTINELQHGDDGNYTFLINNEEIKILRLLIFEKLSDVLILKDNRSLGFLINLRCDITGNPTEYQWWKDGGGISQHHQFTEENSTLVITRSLVSDCGTYTCIAKNPISSIKQDYNLILHVKD
ncbi:hemicentin-2-like [Amblyraja radiata]|uniref:hemicentin-2-like n=1 Tax=Amblyraja radiata TaxID=386614 RepID=UPI001402BFDD|nr:hemicentin-2-like [Amblyraja radiata]